MGEVFVSEEVVQRRRGLVAQSVLLPEISAELTQTLPQLHDLEVIIESAGAMSSPQSLDKEQEDMKRRANPVEGCWSETPSLVAPHSLMTKT